MKNISNIFERIEWICREYGYKSINDFARNALGYSASEKINRLKDGKNKPGIDIIVDISNKFEELNIDWLLFGEEPKRKVKNMLPNETVTKRVTFYDETKNTKNVTVLNEPVTEYNKGIPLIPIEAMAGFGNGTTQVMDYDTKRYLVPEFTELKVDFMIPIKGSSMYPKYNSGDIVACKKLILKDIFFQWNKVYVLDTEQGALIKRIKKSSLEEHIEIVSDNPSYEPFSLHLSKVNAIAIVVGVIRLE